MNPSLSELPEANELLRWADETRRLGVMANADTPADARQALVMGAEGIGLCRTEHMFLDPLRLPAVRQMLLNSEAAEAWRREHEGSPIDPLANPFMNPEVSDIPSEVVDFYQALERVKRLQTNDFRGILRAMSRRPVIIRLLDAPLQRVPAAVRTNCLWSWRLSERQVRRTEKWPRKWPRRKPSCTVSIRCGRRTRCWGTGAVGWGCRSRPSTRMQVEAIITAGAQLFSEGVEVHPEIMVPLTVDVEEMRRLRADLTRVAAGGAGADGRRGTIQVRDDGGGRRGPP